LIAPEEDGKENPDFYLITNPKRAVFRLNWALSKRTEGH
jgi:hypothetical protein